MVPSSLRWSVCAMPGGLEMLTARCLADLCMSATRARASITGGRLAFSDPMACHKLLRYAHEGVLMMAGVDRQSRCGAEVKS